MENDYDKLRFKLAEAVKLARSNAGISQEDLALIANVDRTYVSQLERGIANPSLQILLILVHMSLRLGSVLSKKSRFRQDIG